MARCESFAYAVDIFLRVDIYLLRYWYTCPYHSFDEYGAELLTRYILFVTFFQYLVCHIVGYLCRYFDMMSYGKHVDGLMSDTIPTDEEIAEGLARLPDISGC
jgi:hypothetical protein